MCEFHLNLFLIFSLFENTDRYMLFKLLYPCFSATNTCLISSFLFGFAHFHHYLFARGGEGSLLSTCCRFIFTFLFGLFASSMYFKSTYIITPIVHHSICNFLSLPDFAKISSDSLLTILVSSTFALGISLMIQL